MSGRSRYTERFPCPVCGGHAHRPRHQGQRCTGYVLTFENGGTLAYCSRITSQKPAPLGDLWAHGIEGGKRKQNSHDASFGRLPVAKSSASAPRTSKRWTIHHERHAVAFHPYGGAHPFEVARFDAEWRERGYPKSMPRHRSARGEWFTGAPPALHSMTNAPLYRQTEAVAALERDEPLYIVEGEADVDAIVQHGAGATCNPCGAMKWKPHHTAALAEIISTSKIQIIRDRDADGTKHAARIYSAIWAAGVDRARIAIWQAASGKDARDHLTAGYALDQLVAVPVRIRSYGDGATRSHAEAAA